MRLPSTRSLVLALAVVIAAGSLAPAHAQVGRGTLLDPNVATARELAALPGLGAKAIERLLAARPFKDMLALDSLLAGAAIPPQKRGALYRRLFLQVDLDAASSAEILLIPGVGKRMVHEFLEYRPYTGGLVEFRKEIGKYVDAKELARLEQYVYVRLPLNSASDEDILGIPGVGKRMLHEFKEYRPYSSLAQFRREIGKYVDDRELARLERYVRL
jgi:DNA uptake protein ComE-like DNA-binding protein